jgi:hypothetical protein
MLWTASGMTYAACIKSPDPAVRALQVRAIAHPNEALVQSQPLLREAVAANAPARDIAWLNAVRAQAYSALELNSEARAEAAEGMKRLRIRATRYTSHCFSSTPRTSTTPRESPARNAPSRPRAPQVWPARKPCPVCC